MRGGGHVVGKDNQKRYIFAWPGQPVSGRKNKGLSEKYFTFTTSLISMSMKILVPIDFTPITENALQYAIGLTDVLSVKNIILFHVVSSEKDAAPALYNLNQLMEQYKSKTTAVLETHVSPGNIFDQIGSTAAELRASLIIMGTHGIKGMQQFIGSKAMKVITQSKTPYIVVQKLPYKEIRKILIPVDYTKEIKQLLPLVQSLNDKFKANLVLVKQTSKDEFIENKINYNLTYFKSFLKDTHIPFTESGTYTSSSKYKDVLALAKSSGADLIVTTIDPDTGIADYIMGVEEQKIVANEAQLPVLCINIKHFMKGSGGIFEMMS
jgi:nucleotide-binding universal stress UspA family protein